MPSFSKFNCCGSQKYRVFLGIFVVATVVYFLVPDDIKSRLCDKLTCSKSFALPVTNVLKHFSEHHRCFQNLSSESQSLLKILRWISLTNDIPLILLNEELYESLDDLEENFLCTNSLSIKDFVVFGYIASFELDTDQIIEDSLNSRWLRDQSSFNRSVVLKSRDSNLRAIFAHMWSTDNYWLIDKIPSLNFERLALLKYKSLKRIKIANGFAELSVPEDISFSMFKRAIRSGTFLECNRSLASSLIAQYPEYYNRTVIKDSLVADLAYFRDQLLSINIPVFLLGGTLLGWYRECGIIPYTTDMDLCALASDYNHNLGPLLEKDEKLKLHWRLGKPSDSLEYSVFSGSVKFDLFFLYNDVNSSRSWVGGLISWSRTKLRWTYPPLNQLCTADLKGHLFYVPCQVEDFLSADYGANWYIPHHNDKFVWYKSHNNVQQVGQWNSDEWIEVYKVYV